MVLEVVPADWLLLNTPKPLKP